MKRGYETLIKDVQDEVDNIEQVVTDLLRLRTTVDPNLIDNTQKAAFGAFVMNFYTGIENIIKRISKEYYHKMPTGASWHKELLLQACNPSSDKIPIFTKDLISRLNPYRGFKRLFVSGYGFKLEWDLMSALLDNIKPLWSEIKKAISEFFERLKEE